MRKLLFLGFFISAYGLLAQDTYSDTFDVVSYANNNGNQNWASNWVETNDNASASGGSIQITSGELQFTGITTGMESINRSTNLVGASGAILSFDWRTIGLSATQRLAVQVSSNGGASYTTLDFLTGNTTGSYSANIASYISSSTTIRFLSLDSNWDLGDLAALDNVLISVTLSVNDGDGDGIEDVLDNCPTFANFDQEDTDGDGVGNFCDLDDDNDGILDENECLEVVCLEPIVNEGFETPFVPLGSFGLFNENSVNGWQTTSTDNIIEIWGSGHRGIPSFQGNQHAELNGTQNAALFQVLCLTPGTVVNWSVRHRGRSGVDVAVVRMGADFAGSATQATMTDGTTAWGLYSGTYTVPLGQINTFFIFEAVSTSSGNLSVGNLIDDVQIDIVSSPACLDSDNDGVLNDLDLDGDNDGIYDIVESGNGSLDTNNDGVIDSSNGSVGINGVFDILETSTDSGILLASFETPDTDGDGALDIVDLDSDGDGCLDVFEAGFMESGTRSGELQGTGFNPNNGIVTGFTAGYTTPNDNNSNSIFDFQEEALDPIITTQPIDQIVFHNENTTFTVVSTNTETYQWQLSADGGATFSNLSDNVTYSGTQSATLTINSLDFGMTGQQFRVVLGNNPTILCPRSDTSLSATLDVRVRTVITNRGITFRVQG